MTPDDQAREDRWTREMAEALEADIDRLARVIVALPSAHQRRMALDQWQPRKPAQIRERLEAAVRRLWEGRR